MNGPAPAEERIRAALDGLAESVVVSSDAYRGVQAEWRRRERRRRQLAAVVAAVMVVLAVVVGLWALNRDQPRTGIIFDTERTPVVVVPAPAVVPGPGGLT